MVLGLRPRVGARREERSAARSGRLGPRRRAATHRFARSTERAARRRAGREDARSERAFGTGARAPYVLAPRAASRRADVLGGARVPRYAAGVPRQIGRAHV